MTQPESVAAVARQRAALICLGMLEKRSRIFGAPVDPLSINIVRYVKDTSRTLAYPFFVIAYFLQSRGPVWHFSVVLLSGVHRATLSAASLPTASLPAASLPAASPSLPVFLWILFVKAAIAGVALFFVIAIFNAIPKEPNDDGTGCATAFILFMAWVLRLTLLAFAVIGIFLRANYPAIDSMNIFWFVACLVFGLSMTPEASSTDKK